MCAIFDNPNNKSQQAKNESEGEAVQPHSKWRKKRKDEAITVPSCFGELVEREFIGDRYKKVYRVAQASLQRRIALFNRKELLVIGE